MDNPVINTPRQAVPDWAKGDPTPIPKISDPQRDFLKDLLQKKDLTGVDEGKLDQVWKCLRISEDPEEFGMSKDAASTLITWLLKRKDKPREQAGGIMSERLSVGIPAGRYAVDGDDGLLKFYHVWVSRDKKRTAVYVAHGPEESRLKSHATQMTVLNKIKSAGIRECAIRYGLEIGSCSNCGRRLTNHISRALGIGPVCGGRMFGPGFRPMVLSKRDELIAAGIDPDEEINDD